MPKKSISLISYSICGREKAGKTTFFPAVSTTVVDGEIWTTFHYSNNHSIFWWANKKSDWKNKIPDALHRNFVGLTDHDGTNSIKRSHKNEESIISKFEKPGAVAIKELRRDNHPSQHELIPRETDIKNPLITAENERGQIARNTVNAAADSSPKGVFPHNLKFWCNKRMRGSEESSPSQEDANRERPPKKHRIRRWLNQEEPETIRARRIKKARYDISFAAADAAMVAATRTRAKKAAKAGAFVTAAFARVITEEVNPHASHGSIAKSISKACKDVAKTSVVHKVNNGDYRRLHGLFHYHYKFRGPEYYKPLEPCCYYTKGSDGEITTHCKMDKPVETFRSSAITKDSPLVQFLKHVTEEGGIKRQTKSTDEVENDSNIKAPEYANFVESNEGFSPSDKREEEPLRIIPSEGSKENLSTTAHQSEVSQDPKLGLKDFFKTNSGEVASGVCLPTEPLTPITRKNKDGIADETSILTSRRHFLETFDPHTTFDENVHPDSEGVRTLPRTVSEAVWQGRSLKPTSQFGIESQCLSMRAGSVGMVR